MFLTKAVTKPFSPGFSLVEVTMALGIAALGILALVGLVPGGLDSLRNSSSKVAESKIIQAVVADYQMTDWGSRKQSGGQQILGKTMYFDEQGLSVKSTDPWKHYTTMVTIDPADITLKGDQKANRYLRRLQIKVTADANPTDAFQDTTGRRFRTYGTTVALIEQTDSQLIIRK